MPCYDCGLEYSDDGWIEAIIPDKIWNKIKPDGCEDGCGLLCITCIARRLNKLGMKHVPIWLCGTESVDAMAGDPGDNIDILRNWTVRRYVRRHTHPHRVHVTVCGTYAGFYDFRTAAEADADLADRKKYEVLGCSYRRESPTADNEMKSMSETKALKDNSSGGYLDALLDAIKLLYEAADDIENWGAYASEYFQEKWNLVDDVAKYKKAAKDLKKRTSI